MTKRLTSLILICTLILLSVQAALAASGSSIPKELFDCKFKYTDSSDSGAFIYGFSKKTLYSSMLLPSTSNRSVTLDYNIFSVSQYGTTTYALYKIDVKTQKYGLVGLNMTNGKCSYYEFSSVSDVNSNIFAVSGSSVFFIRADDEFSYVAEYSFDGSYLHKYSFNTNLYSVFCNNSRAYAMLYSGEIYRLASGKASYVAKLDDYADCFNVGTDYICTENGFLVSLKTGEVEVLSQNLVQGSIAKDNNGLYTKSADGVTLTDNNGKEKQLSCGGNIYAILVCKNKTAVIFQSGLVSINSLNEYKRKSDIEHSDAKSDITVNETNFIKISGKYIKIFNSGFKVTKLKSQLSDEITVYNDNDEIVTSGNVRSGYRVSYHNNMYITAVMGDISGEGNVKSNDIKLLMSYLVGEIRLTDLQLVCADYNCDGACNNKDLLLIAKTIE